MRDPSSRLAATNVVQRIPGGSGLELSLVRQLHMAGLPPPVREHRFDPSRGWRFDLAYPDLMVAIEVEGGTWVKGAHSRGKHYESDCEKYSEAAIAGWRLIRVTTDMVDDGRALKFVERILAARITATGAHSG